MGEFKFKTEKEYEEWQEAKREAAKILASNCRGHNEPQDLLRYDFEKLANAIFSEKPRKK